MFLMTSLNIDIEKVKDRLFVFADCKDQAHNITLSLIVNPQIIKILLDQLISSTKQKKLQLLYQLGGLFKNNPNNSLILAKRDAEIQDHNISILDDLINFILTINADGDEIPALGDLFLSFIRLYPVNSKNIRKVTTYLSKLFYEGDFSPNKMTLSIHILKLLFESQIVHRNQPSNYFFFYGENSGIRMIHDKALWMFSKGFTLNISFSPFISEKRASLFAIRVKDSEFEISLSQDLTLCVKVFGDTQEMELMKLLPNKWYYLRLEYLLKSRLFNKVFAMKITIDNRTFEKQNLSVPQINQNDFLDEIVFGQDFYGKINTIFLSREQDFNQNFQIQPPFWTTNWEELEAKFKANKKLFQSLYLVYVPYVSTICSSKNIVYDISSRNHGELLENSTLYKQNFATKDINYYGGLYNLLPLFQLLKYFDPKIYPHMLEDILELFLAIFKTRIKGIQEQTVNCRLFSIMGAQLPEVNQEFITKHSLKLLFSIKEQLKEVVLKEQFFRDLIWKFNIKSIINIEVIKELTKLISIMYELNTSFYLHVYGIESIMHYIIQQFQPIDIKKCCVNHYLHSNIPTNIINLNTHEQEHSEPLDHSYFFQNYTQGRSHPFVVLIIELVNHLFQTKEELGTQSMKVIMMFSVSNHSMCFIKFVLDIIQGVILSEKVNKKQLIDNNLLGFIFIVMERFYHHQIITQLIFLLKVIINWEEAAPFYPKIIFAIISCLKRYPKEVEVQGSYISQVYSPEDGLKRRDSTSSDRQQFEHVASIIKFRKVNYSNYKPLLDIVLSLVIDENSCTINDQAIEVLEVYYQIANSNFKRMAIKHIFCQIYEGDQKIKETMRVEYYSVFKFLLRVLIETKALASDKAFQDQIEKLVIESLAALIIPVLSDRPKIYWYLIKLEALMIIIQRELGEIYNEDFIRLTISYEFRLLFKKILDREQCVLGKGLQNIIFYLYGVMFCSQQKQEHVRLLSYFKILEKELWLIDFNRLPEYLKQSHQGQWLVFIDAEIISIILQKLPLQQFSIHTNHINKVSRLIDPQVSQELKYLKTGLLQQIAQMKSKSPKNQSFFDFFENLLESSLIEEKETPEMKSIKTLSNKNVCLIEVILLMVEISVEYYLKHKKFDKFAEMLQLSERIILGYLFSMINSGESTKNVKIEQNQLMKKVLLTWFHFHYNVMDNEEDISFNEKIEETIMEVFHIISLIASLLSEKIGCLDKLSDCLHYGGIMQNMEGINLYILQFLDQHVLTAKKKPLITLSSIKEFLSMDHQNRLSLVLSEVYKDVFKRSGYMLKLLEFEVVREILEVKAWYRNKLNEEVITCSLGLARENFNQELVKERQELVQRQEDQFKKSEVEFMKETNILYRSSMYSWGKIWKRLRKYHYPWSDWVNQRETRDWSWEGKDKKPQYFKNKFSNCAALDGSRPILQVKLQDPWHVRKRAIEREIEYMAKDYHYNFYKKQTEGKHQNKPKNFLFKIFNRANVSEEDEFNVQWIINNEKRKGALKILPEKLQFLFTSIYQKDSHVDFTHFRLGEFKPLIKVWDLVLITNVIRRRYLTYDQCLLIELENNTSLIFNFTDRNLDNFLSLLSKKQKSKVDQKLFLKINNIRFYTERFDYQLSEYELIKAKTDDWNNRKISNFEYLLALNRFAGRSFYDPTQYPVMPWIVSNYSSEKITMRPLDKTMGALGTESRRLALFEKSKLLDPFNPVPPYQYGTHYSSPGVVFNFMIRVSPYTEAGRTLQGGKFDIADRVFFSLNWAWRSATTQMSDVRQLTPQFYYLPEFLLNLEFYDYGLTQTKERVHNVDLPPWCNNDPYQFITKHRQLLEGESVSLNINSWIDLIFGYKQKGKQAEEALNLYYYLTYQNAIDIESIEDEVNKTSVEAQVVHFGQTPHQLFQKPHQKRQPFIRRISISMSNQYKVYNPKRTVKEAWQNIGQYSKGNEPILAISWTKQNNNIVILKCNNILQYSFFQEEFDFVSENYLNLKKTKNEIHLMDLNFENKVTMFANRFIATGFSLNGELRIYSTEGKLIETQYGEQKNCIFVNSKENLLMTGGKDGLFQVYEIIYQDQNQLSLVSIALEQCYYSISHISEGFGFYTVCSGNIVSVYNINRSAVFVDKKLKKVRCKFLRSFIAKRKISCAQIVSSPLFSIVFYDGTQLWSYSINGQLIANRPTVLKLNPLLYSNQNHMDFIVCLQNFQLIMLSTPSLTTIKVLDLPQKEFTCWTIYLKHILIGTSSGELIVVNKAFLLN